MARVESDDVEVEAEGCWYLGYVRGWDRREGGWWATVSYNTGPGENRIDVFPAHRIRHVLYCPWYRGNFECLGWDGCGLGASPD